jgi:hypothetical protein
MFLFSRWNDLKPLTKRQLSYVAFFILILFIIVPIFTYMNIAAGRTKKDVYTAPHNTDLSYNEIANSSFDGLVLLASTIMIDINSFTFKVSITGCRKN